MIVKKIWILTFRVSGARQRLNSFSLFQDELRKFIKFACNQERIPFGLPCRDGMKDNETHVPPYPMKIAPPDGRGD